VTQLASWLHSSVAVAVAALAAAACGVPDIDFYDAGAGASAEGAVESGPLDAQALDGGSDVDGQVDAAPEAGAATCPNVPPLGASACCDATPCSGDCAGNCGLCAGAGCGANELCCVHARNAVCHSLGSNCQ